MCSKQSCLKEMENEKIRNMKVSKSINISTVSNPGKHW